MVIIWILKMENVNLIKNIMNINFVNLQIDIIIGDVIIVSLVILLEKI